MNWKETVFHNPSGIYLEGAPQGLGSSVRVRLRCSQQAPITGVYLRCAPDGEQEMHTGRPLEAIAGWDCRWWEVLLPLRNQRQHYRFYLSSHEGGFWLTASGLMRFVPTDHHDFVILADQHLSHWLDHSVFYQIFPDRFCDGDPANNVRSGSYKLSGQPVVARDWGELPNVHQGGREFFGGDLQGITQKLPYLQERLGVNGLYLNPINTAPSSHKYDVASYSEVDPHLGGEAAFFELKRAMEARAMRLILDIVPNHCGEEHPWFRQAQQDPGAETAEFFNFERRPDKYECWLGISSLPKLNYSSQRLRDWMYAGRDSIMRTWLRPPWNIDGWRIDVANMLARGGAVQMGHKILRGMRKAVKEERADAYLLGENFFDASAYLQGDQLDATMNYRGFMMPLYHWLTGQDYNAVFERQWADRYPLSGQDLETQWRYWRAHVPWAITRQQFNLLDSHDTPRLINLVGGDRAKAAVARLILMTYPGVPCIYYGDEQYLPGGRDPDNRRTMNWDESSWDHGLLQEWSQLINLRKHSEALARGSIQSLYCEENTLAYLRETREQRCLVVARRAADPCRAVPTWAAAVPEGTAFREFFSGTEAVIANGHLPILESATQIWLSL
jgi:alpha-glucosidase